MFFFVCFFGVVIVLHTLRGHQELILSGIKQVERVEEADG